MRIEKFIYKGFDDRQSITASDVMPPDEPEAPEPVMVSEEVLEEARKQAYEAGLAQGFHDGIAHGRQEAIAEAEALKAAAQQQGAELAITQHHKQLEMTLGFLQASLQSAAQDALEAEIKLRKETAEMALEMAQKLAGAALKNHGIETIREHVHALLAECEDVPSLHIRVAQSQEESVKAQLATLAGHFRGTLSVHPDPALQAGDCRIEWQLGFTERRIDVLSQALNDVIQRHFPDSPTTRNGA